MVKNSLRKYYFHLMHLLLLVVCINGSMVSQINPLLATTRYVGFPAVRNYTPTRYQAHGQNFGITQDKRGMIYVANTSGVLEHDGAT